MLKQSFYTLVLASLFAGTPAFAKNETVKQSQEIKLSEETQNQIEEKRVPQTTQNAQTDDNERSNHPAHDMGESAERSNDEPKDANQENQ